MSFSDQQLLRYSRQLMLTDFDIGGQQALAAARVLIVGVGGLGCPAALYLASAGVGQLYLADDDVVALSNLQRQILFQEDHLQRSKVQVAQAILQQHNADTQVSVIEERMTDITLPIWLPQVDIVLDCSDNPATRLMLNRQCVSHRLPLVSGAASGWQGQLSSFDFREPQSACYQCLFGEIIEEEQGCHNQGVMSPVVGMIGVMQALEAIKLLSGCGTASVGQLQCFDGLNSQWQRFTYQKQCDCRVCGAATSHSVL